MKLLIKTSYRTSLFMLALVSIVFYFNLHVASTIDENLAVYLYPEEFDKRPTDAERFLKGLSNFNRIPGKIIIKFLDILNNGSLKEKLFVSNETIKYFPKDKFKISFMINAPNLTPLDKHNAKNVFDKIKEIISIKKLMLHLNLLVLMQSQFFPKRINMIRCRFIQN